MKYGDRVRVINPDSEWVGCTGVMAGIFLNGTICVKLDHSGWEISFEPFDIDTIDYLTRLSVDGRTIWPPAD